MSCAVLCSTAASPQAPLSLPPFLQTGKGATPRTLLQEVASREISPQQFGAVTNGANTTSAFQNFLNAVCATGRGGYIPDGTYIVMAQLTASCDDFHLRGASTNAVISYTGQADITGILKIGTSGAPRRANFLRNFVITGNTHSRYALETVSVSHSEFEHISLRNVSMAGLRAMFGIDNIYKHIMVSGNESAFSTQPVNGILFEHGSESSGVHGSAVINPIIESVKGAGIKLRDSAAIHFSGGTSESNAIGIDVDGSCADIQFYGIDLEGNVSADAVIGGSRVMLQGITLGLVHITGGNQNKISTTSLKNLTIDAGALGTYLENISVSGTFTDNGSLTEYINLLIKGASSSRWTGKSVFRAPGPGRADVAIAASNGILGTDIPCLLLSNVNVGAGDIARFCGDSSAGNTGVYSSGSFTIGAGSAAYGQNARAMFDSGVRVALNNRVTFAGQNTFGLVLITEPFSGATALLAVSGTHHATGMMSDPFSLFSTAAGTPGRYNAYWSANENAYVIENNKVANAVFYISVIGKGER